MVLISVKCPFCNSDNVVKYGKNSKGIQVYMCKNKECSHGKFPEKYTYRACDPEIKEQIYDLTVNGNGTRAISRILRISKDTVSAALKKTQNNIWQINMDYIERNKDTTIEVELVRIEEAEMDEMWSFVHDKSQQYWLWWAVDHDTGEPLAYVFGTKEHANLDKLRALLNPFFDIKTIYTDGNAAYENITESQVLVGKKNTQRIENRHIALRTWCSRLVRKGIRFSKSHLMHRIAIGIVINFWFFNHAVW